MKVSYCVHKSQPFVAIVVSQINPFPPLHTHHDILLRLVLILPSPLWLVMSSLSRSSIQNPALVFSHMHTACLIHLILLLHFFIDSNTVEKEAVAYGK
jgi:hypothetical protein